jgi:Ca2+-binding EF-hand superfamily protein
MTPNFDKLTKGANNKTMTISEADTILTELEKDLITYRAIVSVLGVKILTFRQNDNIREIYQGIDRKKSGKPSGGGTRKKRHHSYPLKHTFKNRRA